MFAAEGVAVDIDLPQDSGRMIADFSAGSYDLVGVALGDLITVAAVRPGTRLILVSDESAGGDLLIGHGVRPSAGVLRIGTRLGGFGELLIERFRKHHDIPATRIQLLQVDAADAPGLLARGEVDAVHTWQPYAAGHHGHRTCSADREPGRTAARSSPRGRMTAGVAGLHRR